MRTAFPLLLAAALATGLVLRCASSPSEPTVRVTHDRAAVRNCVNLARIATDLGGNVLLVYNEHSGGAFYCANPPVKITIPAPVANTTPRRPH